MVISDAVSLMVRPLVIRSSSFQSASLRFEHLNKGFLRNIDFSYALHSLLSLFLFLEQFALPGDIAAVAFRGYVFSQCRNALACNNFPANSCLDRYLVKLARNYFL